MLGLLWSLTVFAQDAAETQEASPQLTAVALKAAGVSPQWMQSALKAVGHYDGAIDGQIGQGTRASIDAWQQSQSFPATGTLSDDETVALIRLSATAGLAKSQNILDALRASGVLAEAQPQEPPPPADSERIGTLELTIEGLDKSFEIVSESIKANSQLIANLDERVSSEFKRMDPITLHLDSVTTQTEEAAEIINKQQTRIEDNSVKLYEILLGIDTTQQDLDAVRRQYQAAQAASEENAPAALAGTVDADLRLLLSTVLCLLVPIAALLYQGGLGGTNPAAGPAPVVWIVLAWLGGGIGYYLAGFGIMFGTSQGGWIGAPLHFFSEVLMSVPAQMKPELLAVLIPQILLAGIAGVVICSAVADRLSLWGHLFVALVFGGVIYPLFGHWTSASQILSGQYGWLSAGGYLSSPGTTGVALLAGVGAISLAGGLPQPGEHAREGQSLDPIGNPTLGAILLWIAWPGVMVAASAQNLHLAALLLASSVAFATAGLSVLVFDALFSADPRWQQRLPGAALTGLIAAGGAYADASVIELSLLGLLAGLSFTLLMRPLNKRAGARLEFAAILAAGGLWGALAPALFGIDGFLSAHSIDGALPQLQGVGAALALALVAGRLLAWPVRRMALLRTNP